MTGAREPRWEFGRRLVGRWWRSPERDLRDEMALHVELRAADLRAQGLDDAEARARAQREVGAVERVAPVAVRLAHAAERRRRVSQLVDEVLQDVRSAWRSSRRSPGFTALVLLTIALGLGANAAIFGVVNVTMFTPLPFDPDNTLVRVREFRATDGGGQIPVDASGRTAEAVARMSAVFRDSVALSGTGRALAREGGALRLAAMRVGPGFTRVVGITPFLGRPFTPDEEQAGEAGGAALISHRLWQTVLGGAPDVIGRTIRLDDHPFVVTGVLPVNFHVPYDTDVWFPSRFEPNERSVFILARLAPGVTVGHAQAALLPIGEELNRRYPDLMRGLGVTAVQARDFFVNDEHRMSLVLMAAVGLLLLIACTNVALLLTTRFAARQAEVAMRAALGCDRSRQIRQFVTEGVALYLVGGAVGLAVAVGLGDVLVVLLPENLAHEVGLTGIPLDWTLVGFSAAVSLVTGVGFGLLAAMRTTQADLHAVMKGSGRSVAGAASRGLLGGLVVAEVALAVVLLFSAGVMVDTFRRLSARDLGFRTEGVTSAQMDLTAPRYLTQDARRVFVSRLLERLATVPGVEAAGITTVNPLCCGDWGARVLPDGVDVVTQADAPIVQHFIVSPGYFDAVRRPFVDGRNFGAQDGPTGAPVVIVDRAMAARFWPGQSAIGKRVRRWSATGAHPWLTIVGVVESATEGGEYPESWYLPHAQNADGPSADGIHLMVRGPEPAAVARAVRGVVADMDPALALYGVTTLDALVGENLRQDRMGAWISAVFGAAGLLLAALGLYGVLMFVVTGDRVEIAVRRALGASGRDVVLLILGRGLRLMAYGFMVGGVSALGLAQVIPRYFEDAQPELRLVGVAVAILFVTGVVAMAAPVRRALRLDPLAAMRQ